MKKIFVLFSFLIISACAISPSKQLTTQPEIFLIPEAEPPTIIFASLPISNLVGLKNETIARRLLEEFLNQWMRDDDKTYKITAYEIVEIKPQSQQLPGRFYGCYILTPASEGFIINNSWPLEDGRIETCNVFGVSKDSDLYYLSGYYGG